LGKKEKIEKIEKIEKKIEKRLSQIINLIFMGLFHPQGVPTKRRSTGVTNRVTERALGRS
jgi:hypothetical protein